MDKRTVHEQQEVRKEVVDKGREEEEDIIKN